MNFVTLVLGLLLVGAGFVTLVHKLHDRSMHESLAMLRSAHGDTARAVASFAGLLAPIVTSIAGGLAFLAIGLLTRY